MGTVDCFAGYTKWKREKQMATDMEALLEFAWWERYESFRDSFVDEMFALLFPEGREKAFQELETKIHNLTFGRLRADDGDSGTC